MHDVVFIGHHRDVALFRDAGIPSYAPPIDRLAERVLAERGRYRVLAMTEETFRALPTKLARELREGHTPHLEIVPAPRTRSVVKDVLRRLHFQIGTGKTLLA